MSRPTFLLVAAVVGCVVGLLSLLAPAVLLATKNVPADAVTQVWVREVGALILATALLGLLVRRHPDSPTLRAVLLTLALAQLGLLVVELAAWAAGVLPLTGVVGNSVVHLLLAAGFATYAHRMRGGSSPVSSPAR